MKQAIRIPIVAVMGHIDHGKSSLLDYIRKSNVVAGEAGGITQRVSAYVATHTYEGKERQVTFLDTPGHEAFQTLRARGARAADIGILVIAADEGIKPQTIEAWKAAENANIPFVVAFTKIDKPNADIERAKIAALEAGIYLEGLGGSIPYAGVSSVTGAGVSDLLDLVLLSADLIDLVSNTDVPAEGFVLESANDSKNGITGTLIIRNGTLKTGMVITSGNAIAPVRFIENFQGKRITEAGAGEPVRIGGFSELPFAGALFNTHSNKKEAEKWVVNHQSDNAPTTQMEEHGEQKATLPLIVKSDVSGGVEAVLFELKKISHEAMHPKIISHAVGAITENDVKIAHTTNAAIIGFNTVIDAQAKDLADRLGVSVSTFSIIYEIQTWVEKLLKERAPRIEKEEVLGRVKVLKCFSVAGNKQVLGANLLEGVIAVNTRAHLERRGIHLADGRVINLQQARADVKEIKTEGEFGMQFECKEEIAGGDMLVLFEIKTI